MTVRFANRLATSMAAGTFLRTLYRNYKITVFRDLDLFDFHSR